MSGRLPGACTGRAAVAFCISLATLALVSYSSFFHELAFGDTDTLTRIAYLRHVGWSGILDPLFSRDGAPDGMLLEWTLPFNALTLLGGNVLGWTLTSLLLGPASLVFLLWSAFFTSRGIGRHSLPVLPSILSCMPVCIAYTQAGRISHHGMTAALCLLSVGLALRWWRKPGKYNALMVGLCSGMALWQSMEAIPMVLAGWLVCMVAVGGWPYRMRGTWAYGAGVLLVMVPALVLDGPWPRFAAFDLHRLSFAHLLLMCAAALGLCMAHAASRHMRKKSGKNGQGTQWGRVAASLAIGIPPLLAALVLDFMLRPQIVYSALFNSYFWSPIGELGNIVSNPSLVMMSLAIPVLTALTWIGCCMRRTSVMRAAIMCILVGTIVMGCCYIRMIAHAESMTLAVGGAMLGSLLSVSFARSRIVLIGFSIIVFALHTGDMFIPEQEWSAAERQCRASHDYGVWLKNSLAADAIVMGDLWLSPSLLDVSGVRTVSGPYHGNPSGIDDVSEFMMTTNDRVALAIMTRRHAAAVVICGASWHTRGAPWPDHSMARLLSLQTPPAWLEEMPGAPPSGLRAWRLVPQ